MHEISKARRQPTASPKAKEFQQSTQLGSSFQILILPTLSYHLQPKRNDYNIQYTHNKPIVFKAMEREQ